MKKWRKARKYLLLIHIHISREFILIFSFRNERIKRTGSKTASDTSTLFRVWLVIFLFLAFVCLKEKMNCYLTPFKVLLATQEMEEEDEKEVRNTKQAGKRPHEIPPAAQDTHTRQHLSLSLIRM